MLENCNVSSFALSRAPEEGLGSNEQVRSSGNGGGGNSKFRRLGGGLILGFSRPPFFLFFEISAVFFSNF